MKMEANLINLTLMPILMPKVANLFKGKWYDTGIEVCVWLILLLVPLSFSANFYLSYELPKVLLFRELVYFMAFFFIFKIVAGDESTGMEKQGGKAGRFLPAVFGSKVFRWLLLAVPLVFILTTMFSIEPLVSFWGNYFRQQGLFSYIHYAVFFFIILVNFGEREYKRAFGFGFVGLGLALVYGIAQSFGFLIGNWNIDTFLGRVFSSFGHPNYFSLYILILFFPLVGWCISAIRRRGWWSVGISAILIGLSLMNFVLTKGRASVLGLFAGLVLFLVLMGLYLKDRRVLLAAILPPLILVAGVVFANVYKDTAGVGENVVMSRLVLEGENTRSIETRLIMWPSVWDTATESPLYGHGMDTFAQSYAPHMDKRLLLVENFSEIPDRSHNVMLQWLVDFGFVGVGILVFGLIWLGWYVIGGIRRLKRKEFDRAVYSAAGLSSVFGVFVANQFGFTVTVHMVVLSFILAMTLGLLGKEVPWRKFRLGYGLDKLKGRLKVLFGIVLGLMVLVLFSGLNLRTGMADHYFLKGYQGVKGSEFFQSLETIVEANDLNPNQNYYKFYLGSVYRDLADAVADDEEARAQSLEAAARFAKEGVEFSSGNDGVQRLLLAKIYSHSMDLDVEKYYPLAAEEFSFVRELTPLYPDAILKEGVFYYLTGEDEKAIERFEYYLSLSPIYWQYKLTPEKFAEDEGAFDDVRLFYKANPRFNEVFNFMEEVYRELGEIEKAEYYSQL